MAHNENQNIVDYESKVRVGYIPPSQQITCNVPTLKQIVDKLFQKKKNVIFFYIPIICA